MRNCFLFTGLVVAMVTSACSGDEGVTPIEMIREMENSNNVFVVGGRPRRHIHSTRKQHVRGVGR